MNYFPFIVGYLLLMNVILYGMMGLDKKRARKRKRRIPEKRLWLFAVLGGALGGYLGMRRFHHKTKHRSFLYGYPVLVIFETIFVGYLVLKLYGH